MRLERNIGADSRGKKHQADIFIIIHIVAVPAEYEIKIVITGAARELPRRAGGLLWDLGN